MSAAALTAVPAAGRDDRPGLGRLTLVELRKMTDTRAGFWLQLAIVALTVISVVALMLTAEDKDKALDVVLSLAIQPAAILGPVVGVLLVSSEWSQRTAQITFSLVPRRGRVMGAKVLAGVVWCLIAFAAALAVSVLATAIGGVPGAFDVPVGQILQDLVYIALSVLGGIAFGAALLASAPAIVLYFVLPIGWSILGSLSFLEDIARWLDTSRTFSPMVEDLLSGKEWAQVATSAAAWILLPFAIGMWRILKGEVR